MNATEPSTELIVSIDQVWEGLPANQRYWIDYRACQGLLFGADGSVKRMTIHECAAYCRVSHQTLYDWEGRIYRFREIVDWRREQLFSDKVVGAAWAASAVRAAKGEDAAVERILTNFYKNYKSPKIIQAQEVGDSIAEIFALMHKRWEVINGDFTEAEVSGGGVDSGSQPGTLPARS